VKKPVPLDPGVLELDPFILNLADPAGDRYFRISLRLVLDQRAIVERAASGLAQAKLRDRILAVLSKKRAGEMTSLEGKERLRAEILAASEALLAEPPFHDAEHAPAPGHVVDVLFTEFLVQ
jgi:flagellar FliL protein